MEPVPDCVLHVSHSLTDWLTNWLTVWLSDRLSDQLTDWLTGRARRSGIHTLRRPGRMLDKNWEEQTPDPHRRPAELSTRCSVFTFIFCVLVVYVLEKQPLAHNTSSLWGGVWRSADEHSAAARGQTMELSRAELVHNRREAVGPLYYPTTSNKYVSDMLLLLLLLTDWSTESVRRICITSDTFLSQHCDLHDKWSRIIWLTTIIDFCFNS